MLSLASASFSYVAPTVVPRSSPVMMNTLMGSDYAKTLPGVGPFGFFDPLGLTNNLTPGKVRYFREVEVKHGRVAMLGAVGFVLAESFHPLFGGDIDVPSYVAFQATPLQDLWQGVVATIGIIEFFSITQVDGSFEIRETFPSGDKREAGDFMFDPLGLKPDSPTKLAEMQAKELNNGRLAMIAMAGMVGQELATGSKLF